jgi:hypothetical protein
VSARVVAIGLIVLCYGVGFAQSIPKTEADKSVQVLLNQISQGSFEGTALGPVSRLGDASAVALTRILKDKKPSPKEIEGMLFILRTAFAAPKAIDSEADIEPKTA